MMRKAVWHIMYTARYAVKQGDWWLTALEIKIIKTNGSSYKEFIKRIKYFSVLANHVQPHNSIPTSI